MGYNRIAGADVDYPVPVYVPAFRGVGTILSGSGIVGMAYPDAYPDPRVLAYYEGNKYASNIVTWADRCYHAASRMGCGAAYNYPTIAFTLVAPDFLTPVGTFDGDRIDLLDDVEGEVRAWLDLPGERPLADECLLSRLLPRGNA